MRLVDPFKYALCYFFIFFLTSEHIFHEYMVCVYDSFKFVLLRPVGMVSILHRHFVLIFSFPSYFLLLQINIYSL